MRFLEDLEIDLDHIGVKLGFTTPKTIQIIAIDSIDTQLMSIIVAISFPLKSSSNAPKLEIFRHFSILHSNFLRFWFRKVDFCVRQI